MSFRSTNLQRVNSNGTPHIVAHADNIPQDSIDCGITQIECCNSPCCQKLGTAKSFLTVLIFIGILQGAFEIYFIASVRQAARDFNIDQVLVDWLLVSSGIFMGLLAVLVAYWGNKIHRISWIASVTMIQAIIAATVIIPTLTHSGTSNTVGSTSVDLTCSIRTNAPLIDEKPHAIVTLVLLFILQIGNALGHIVYITHGLSYLDDNLEEHESPGYIAAALAAKFWGPQIGLVVLLGVGYSPFGWWFGWTLLAPILFICGFIICLFPRQLISSMVKEAAIEIVEVATNGSQGSLGPKRFLADVDFWPSFKRLITNKILMFNVFAAVFIQTAITNFVFFEQSYMQSRFFFPDAQNINNDWTSRIVSSLLKPPMVALSIIVAGMIIAKVNPGPRKLALWNIITGLLVVAAFISFIFLGCDNGPIAGAYHGKLTKPFCASSCVCADNIPFSPVCPADSVQTYYSPCHAGCSGSITINNFQVFQNCSCGVDTSFPTTGVAATEGGCNHQKCQKMWVIFQSLSILAASFLGSGLVGNLILSIRSVLPQDKALALSFELWFVGLFAYIPGQIGYRTIADATCQLWSTGSNFCHLHDSDRFGDILNLVSAVLVATGVLFDLFVFIFVKDLPLYGEKKPKIINRAIPLQSVSQPYDSPGPSARQSEHSNYEVEPYATTSLLPTIQEHDTHRSFSPTFSAQEESPTTPPNGKLNALVYAELARNNPDEHLPLNFNLQSESELSGPTTARFSPQPGTSGAVPLRANPVNDDSDSDAGVNYARLIRPSQMKEMVKRQSQLSDNNRHTALSAARAQSPETNL